MFFPRFMPRDRIAPVNLCSSIFFKYQRNLFALVNLWKRSTMIVLIPSIFAKDRPRSTRSRRSLIKKPTVSELEWVERGRRAADKTGAMPHHSTEHTTYVHVLRLTSAWHACLGELSHGGLRKLSEDQRLESKSWTWHVLRCRIVL